MIYSYSIIHLETILVNWSFTRLAERFRWTILATLSFEKSILSPVVNDLLTCIRERREQKAYLLPNSSQAASILLPSDTLHPRQSQMRSQMCLCRLLSCRQEIKFEQTFDHTRKALKAMISPSVSNHVKYLDGSSLDHRCTEHRWNIHF